MYLRIIISHVKFTNLDKKQISSICTDANNFLPGYKCSISVLSKTVAPSYMLVVTLEMCLGQMRD